MNVLVSFLIFAFGIFFMLYGADRFVSGGSALAAYYRISPLLIGMTVVAFGTSFPEFAASFVGALRGKTDISMGNVVGSNICNLGLVLGAAALTRPITVQAGLIRQEIPFVLVLSVLTWAMARNHRLDRPEGFLLSLLFVLFLWYCVAAAKRDQGEVPADVSRIEVTSLASSTAKILFGLVALFLGADLMIRSAVVVAEKFGVTQAVIGLTLVALGTSLPELVTSLVAIKKGEGDIGLGNILGSNIFNILFVLGATASIHPIPSSPQFFRIDLPVMIGFTAILLPIAKTQMRISRAEGAFLLLGYGGYLLLLARTGT